VKQYYVERAASGYVGNCLLWWAKDGHGYTCDLSRAEVFDEAAAGRLAQDMVFRVWEKTYIDSCTQPHVDHQQLNRDLAGIGGGLSHEKD